MKDDVSGMLVREPTRTVIGINQGHAATRQRFPVAHEIGHLQLHKGSPPGSASWSSEPGASVTTSPSAWPSQGCFTWAVMNFDDLERVNLDRMPAATWIDVALRRGKVEHALRQLRLAATAGRLDLHGCVDRRGPERSSISSPTATSSP
ncbi:ImmA/IrrE family metallo-endopeptidase [Actinomadura geliboluensis]|uniref:ImmA/IrrE family metallo-endopeptidase n=1 Tax=Actinomadura geliboluensis TaxID=882440 RepID=UPI00261F83AC|nr:ImmA/IrrE family metallo-endopeptidase [Actinomadura geliboluensis]